jgi:hypothetical protein
MLRTEEAGQPFRYDVELLSKGSEVTPDTVVGSMLTTSLGSRRGHDRQEQLLGARLSGVGGHRLRRAVSPSPRAGGARRFRRGRPRSAHHRGAGIQRRPQARRTGSLPGATSSASRTRSARKSCSSRLRSTHRQRQRQPQRERGRNAIHDVDREGDADVQGGSSATPQGPVPESGRPPGRSEGQVAREETTATHPG